MTTILDVIRLGVILENVRTWPRVNFGRGSLHISTAGERLFRKTLARDLSSLMIRMSQSRYPGRIPAAGIYLHPSLRAPAQNIQMTSGRGGSRSGTDIEEEFASSRRIPGPLLPHHFVHSLPVRTPSCRLPYPTSTKGIVRGPFLSQIEHCNAIQLHQYHRRQLLLLVRFLWLART